DLVLLCVESGREPATDEQGVLDRYPTVLVRTKADLTPAGPGELGVSAVTGAGLDRLRRALVERGFCVLDAYGDLQPMRPRDRHRLALEQAVEALDAAAPELADGGESVLAAHHLRRAVAALDELIGAVDIEEVLGAVFSLFCVGK